MVVLCYGHPRKLSIHRQCYQFTHVSFTFSLEIPGSQRNEGICYWNLSISYGLRTAGARALSTVPGSQQCSKINVTWHFKIFLIFNLLATNFFEIMTLGSNRLESKFLSSSVVLRFYNPLSVVGVGFHGRQRAGIESTGRGLRPNHRAEPARYRQ